MRPKERSRTSGSNDQQLILVSVGGSLTGPVQTPYFT